MGKAGRCMAELSLSGDPEDLTALFFSDRAFQLASQFIEPSKSHAPLTFFDLHPDSLDQHLFDHLLWRCSTRFMGPWVTQGVAKALINPEANFDPETRMRYAMALECSGTKSEPRRARDFMLVLGIATLHKQGVSISGKDSRSAKVSNEEKYAAHRAIEYNQGNITADAIEKIWKERSKKLAAVFGGQDRKSWHHMEPLCRTILEF